MAATMYQKRLANRRATSDITRLTDQYQRQIQSITGNYEQAFGKFKENTDKETAAYDATLAKYRSDVDAYQKQVSDYNTNVLGAYEKQLAAYNRKLDDYYGTFVMQDKDTYATWTLGGKGNVIYNVSDSRWYGTSQIPANVMFTREAGGLYVERTGKTTQRALQQVKTGPYTRNYIDPTTNQVLYKASSKGFQNPTFDQRVGSNYYITGSEQGGFTVNYFPDEPKDQAPAKPAAFSGKAPVAPGPAPKLGEFDDAPFQQQREQAESTFKRELAERRGSRLATVQRRAARPLLRSA